MSTPSASRWNPTVTTDAGAAQAARVTGVGAWGSPGPWRRVSPAEHRRAFASTAEADTAAALLRASGAAATVSVPPAAGESRERGVRVPEGTWRAAGTALDDLHGDVTVSFTITPGMSRGAVTVAALEALLAAIRDSATT